jgi:glyoxylase-like metal-dependent hydrolase (beta-lactamase superfamily II)
MPKSAPRTITALDYPCGDPPGSGAAREVAPGVLWIRMHMPSSLGVINLWALEDDGGWTLVDTGIHAPEVVREWEALLAGPLGGKPVRRVLLTHLHADHSGMAGWLTCRTGARLWMTRLEYLSALAMTSADVSRLSASAQAFYRRAGWDADAMARYQSVLGRYQSVIYPLPDHYRRLHDGEAVRIGAHTWRVVVGSGHSPEHACLFCETLGILISGDQVLPRISSNLSVAPAEPEADPLADWLASLRKLREAVPPDVLVLPAHNEPFTGLHTRLASLDAGHERKLAALLACLAVPRRVVDAFPVLFSGPVPPAEPSRYALATGEALAYLNYLLFRGDVMVEDDASGVAWYRAPTPVD